MNIDNCVRSWEHCFLSTEDFHWGTTSSAGPARGRFHPGCCSFSWRSRHLMPKTLYHLEQMRLELKDALLPTHTAEGISSRSSRPWPTTGKDLMCGAGMAWQSSCAVQRPRYLTELLALSLAVDPSLCQTFPRGSLSWPSFSEEALLAAVASCCRVLSVPCWGMRLHFSYCQRGGSNGSWT